jgi:hypothetical protein
VVDGAKSLAGSIVAAISGVDKNPAEEAKEKAQEDAGAQQCAPKKKQNDALMWGPRGIGLMVNGAQGSIAQMVCRKWRSISRIKGIHTFMRMNGKTA